MKVENGHNIKVHYKGTYEGDLIHKISPACLVPCNQMVVLIVFLFWWCKTTQRNKKKQQGIDTHRKTVANIKKNKNKYQKEGNMTPKPTDTCSNTWVKWMPTSAWPAYSFQSIIKSKRCEKKSQCFQNWKKGQCEPESSIDPLKVDAEVATGRAHCFLSILKAKRCEMSSTRYEHGATLVPQLIQSA